MKWYDLPFALMGFLGFVAVVPAWMYFLSTHTSGLSMEAEFFAGLVLPALVALYLASWVQPGGT